MNTLTFDENCALRLLRVCAAPRKTIGVSTFHGCRDASGNDYHRLFTSLQDKGKIRVTLGNNEHSVIEILS